MTSDSRRTSLSRHVVSAITSGGWAVCQNGGGTLAFSPASTPLYNIVCGQLITVDLVGTKQRIKACKTAVARRNTVIIVGYLATRAAADFDIRAAVTAFSVGGG